MISFMKKYMVKEIKKSTIKSLTLYYGMFLTAIFKYIKVRLNDENS